MYQLRGGAANQQATIEHPQTEFSSLAGPEPGWLTDSNVVALRLREGLPFAADEYRRRWHAVRQKMSAQGLDCVACFRPSSIDYLTGYHSSSVTESFVIVTTDAVILVIPTAEIGRAIVAGCPTDVLFAEPDRDKVRLGLTDVCGRLMPRARVGIEYGDPFTPVRAAGLIEEAGCDPIDARFLVETVRLLLSEAEVACMRDAAELTGQGVSAALRAARENGATDSTIAAATIAALAGTTDGLVKPEVVVCAGWRGGITHANWVGYPIEMDTTTFLEFTGAVHHYVAPVMRTFLHGESTPEIRYLDDRARFALDTTLDLLRPGSRACDIADHVTKRLGDLNPNVVWHYTYGYPVGLAHGQSWVDTVPFSMLSLRADCTAELEPGMAFHLPMSFRWFGHAAVGHSETVLLTESGIEVLTTPAGEPHLMFTDS